MGLWFCLPVIGLAGPSEKASLATTQIISLDGTDWLSLTDPNNQGLGKQWFTAPQPQAKPTAVPGIIQDTYPGYHGVVWYWRKIEIPAHPHIQSRYLLRFWSVFYKTDVWVNGTHIGAAESFNTPFVFDITDAVKSEGQNVLAVRIIDPGANDIEGYRRGQVPGGNLWPYGGFEESVELLLTPVVRIQNMFVRSDWQTGNIHIQARLHNSLNEPELAQFEFGVALQNSGETIQMIMIERTLPIGDSVIEADLMVRQPHLWSLADPFLYRVTTSLKLPRRNSLDEFSVRMGFRDFRVAKGYFRLNGKRIYLKSSHTGNEMPIGIRVPYDPDWLRRDLINVKAMGFNCIRFFQSTPLRYQLDLCDEIGLLAIDEPRGGWLYDDSPYALKRYTNSVRETILRDRNHTSVIAWGLLNEHPWATGDSEQFRHTVGLLAMIRQLDDSRLVLLGSGRWDCQPAIGSVSNPGSNEWECLLGIDSPNAQPIEPLCGKGGPPRQEPGASPIAGYVGPLGDIHVYPPTPHTGEIIEFLRTVGQGTKNVFVSEYGIASAVDLVRLARHYEQRGKEYCDFAQDYRKRLDLFLRDWERWQMADCFGRPEDYFADCIAHNGPRRLIGINALRANPYVNGYSLTGTSDQGRTGEGLITTFRELKPGVVDALFDGLAPLRWCLFTEPVHVYRAAEIQLEAVLANEDVLLPGSYPARLEVFDVSNQKVFTRHVDVKIPNPTGQPEPSLALSVFSEQVTAAWPTGKYRFTATFDRGAAATGGEAVFYITDASEIPKVDSDVVLWGKDSELETWLNKQQDIRVRPFTPGKQKSPELILVSRQPQPPGGTEAFTELVRNIVRGSTAIFLCPEVFAREIKTGEFVEAKYTYNAEGTVAELFGEPGDPGPALGLVYYNDTGAALTFVPPALHGLVIGSSGHSAVVRWTAPETMNVNIKGMFTEGNRASVTVAVKKGNEKLFNASDSKDIPFNLETTVRTSQSIDFVLKNTSDCHHSHTGLAVNIISEGKNWDLNRDVLAIQPADQKIMANRTRSSFGPWSYGFISDSKHTDSTGWVPLVRKGTPINPGLTSYVYPKDTWARQHAIFDGMPAGGLLDDIYYRELFSKRLWSDQDVPSEIVAASIVTSWNYYSGLRIGVYDLGAGRFVLNSFRIRENLGTHPAAERLLKNILVYTATDIRQELVDLPADFDSFLTRIGY